MQCIISDRVIHVNTCTSRKLRENCQKFVVKRNFRGLEMKSNFIFHCLVEHSIVDTVLTDIGRQCHTRQHYPSTRAWCTILLSRRHEGNAAYNQWYGNSKVYSRPGRIHHKLKDYISRLSHIILTLFVCDAFQYRLDRK